MHSAIYHDFRDFNIGSPPYVWTRVTKHAVNSNVLKDWFFFWLIAVFHNFLFMLKIEEKTYKIPVGHTKILRSQIKKKILPDAAKIANYFVVSLLQEALDVGKNIYQLNRGSTCWISWEKHSDWIAASWSYLTLFTTCKGRNREVGSEIIKPWRHSANLSLRLCG